MAPITKLFRSLISFGRLRLFFLAFFWCLSFTVGILFARSNQSVTVSLMCTAPMCRVSIFGLVVTRLFPLLLSAVAAYFSVPNMIFPIVFLKGASFGFCLFGAIMAYNSAGWLVFALLTFSEAVMIVPQLRFWSLCLSERTTKLHKHFISCFLAMLMLCAVDYFAIAPFLTALFFE